MTIKFSNMNDAESSLTIRNALLQKYRAKKPRQFLQIDHRAGGEVGACPIVWELMEGAAVRVLLNGDISDRSQIAVMLRELADAFENVQKYPGLTLSGLADPTNVKRESDRIRYERECGMEIDW